MNSGTTFNPATMISVKAEGALGNGSSDDTGAVQKAELDAKAQGKTVFFDQGIYGLSAAIQIESGVTFLGSYGGVTLKGVNGNSLLLTNVSSSAAETQKIQVSGITFDGGLVNGQRGSSNGPLVYIHDANLVSFSGDTIHNTDGIGALFSNTDNSGFLESTFSNIDGIPTITSYPETSIGGGVVFTAGAQYTPKYQYYKASNTPPVYNYVVDTTFLNAGNNAISADGQSGFDVVNNSFSQTTSAASTIGAPAGQESAAINLTNLKTTLIWNIDEDGNGINVTPIDGAIVSGNIISGTPGYGLSATNSSGLIISGNKLIENSAGGINFNGVSNTKVTENEIIGIAASSVGNSVFHDISFTGSASSAVDLNSNTISEISSHPASDVAVYNDTGSALSTVYVARDNLVSGIQTIFGGTPVTSDASQWAPVLGAEAAFYLGLAPSFGSTHVGTASPVTLGGLSDPYATITLREGHTVLGQTTSTAEGRFTFSPAYLANGTHVITATEVGQLDAAVRTTTLDVVLNASAPKLTATVVSTHALDSVDGRQSLAGTSDANATVTLSSGSAVIGTTMANATGGWSYSLPKSTLGEKFTALASNSVGTSTVTVSPGPSIWLTANELMTGGYSWLRLPVTTNGVDATAAAVDFAPLIDPSNILQWGQVAADTKVFKMYSNDVLNLTESQRLTIAVFVKENNYSFMIEGLESLANNSNDLGISKAIYQRCAAAGLTIDYMDLDEPLGSIGRGVQAQVQAANPGFTQEQTINSTLQVLATYASSALSIAKTYFPNIKFGYTEGINKIIVDGTSTIYSVSSILTFMKDFRLLSGSYFSFFQADGAYNWFSTWQSQLEALSSGLVEMGVPLNVLIAEFGQSSEQVVDTDLKNVINLFLDSSKISISSLNFQSWGRYPTAILSDTTAGTLTNAALESIYVPQVNVSFQDTLNRPATFYELFYYSKLLATNKISAGQLSSIILTSATADTSLSVSMQDTYLTQSGGVDDGTGNPPAVGLTIKVSSTVTGTTVDVLQSTTTMFSIVDTVTNTQFILDTPDSVTLNANASIGLTIANSGMNRVTLGAAGQGVADLLGPMTVTAQASQIVGSRLAGNGSAELDLSGGGQVFLNDQISGFQAIRLGQLQAAQSTWDLATSSSQAGLTIFASGGNDVITLGSVNQTVYAASTGSLLVRTTAAQAAAAVVGSAGALTTLEITTGGSFALNAATNYVVVQIDAPAVSTTVTQSAFYAQIDPSLVTSVDDASELDPMVVSALNTPVWQNAVSLNSNANVTFMVNSTLSTQVTLGARGQKVVDTLGAINVTSDATFLDASTVINVSVFGQNRPQLAIVGGGQVALGNSVVGVADILLNNGGVTHAYSSSYALTLSSAQDGATVHVRGGDTTKGPWTGVDMISISDATQSVSVEPQFGGSLKMGSVVVKASAAAAAASVLGAVGVSTTLDVTSGGTVALNSGTKNVIVLLDAQDPLSGQTNVQLNANAKVTVRANNSAAHSVTLGAAGQKIIDKFGPISVTTDALFMTIATSLTSGQNGQLSILGGGKVALSENAIGFSDIYLNNGGVSHSYAANYTVTTSVAQLGMAVHVRGGDAATSPWTGTDTIFLVDSTQSVVVDTAYGGSISSGAVVVKAGAAAASACILGALGVSTTLEITSAGTVSLNDHTTLATVKLDCSNLLLTNKASFLTINAMVGNADIEVTGAGTTVLAGQGDIVADLGGLGVLLQGTSTSLRGDFFKSMNALDSIDITNFEFAGASITTTNQNGLDHLMLANRGMQFDLYAAKAAAGLQYVFSGNGHGGTLINLH